MQVIANIAETEEPAMILHTKIEEEDWKDYKTTDLDPNGGQRPLKGQSMDPTSPRVQKLIEQYKERNFELEDPQPGNPAVFLPHTRLYVRNGFGQA